MFSSSFSIGATLPFLSLRHFNLNPQHPTLNSTTPLLSSSFHLPILQSTNKHTINPITLNRNACFISCCFTNDSNTELSDDSDTTETPTPTPPPPPTTTMSAGGPPPLVKKRKRYRKLYPGESQGIVEEMRFVAMKLHNNKVSNKNDSDEEEGDDKKSGSDNEEGSWQPGIEGFLKYLVDSKLVFQTLERIVDESDNVSYAYFRKTGLERSEMLSKDLEWFRLQDLEIPEPSNPGVSYAQYLEALAEKSAPMFLCHFYNIYFGHISGGQVIIKQVSEKILEGRELEFCRWDGDELELLKSVRDKLNQLGEHWMRDDKNKCLREVSKSFKYMGQIVRLIIL